MASTQVTKSILEIGGGRRDTVQTGPFGSQLHADDYVEDGVPFILIRNIGDDGLIEASLPRISYEDATRLARYAVREGDIVFSRVGRTGSCLYISEQEAGWIISGQTLRLRLPEEAINHRFLLYSLRSHATQAFVATQSVGTTRESLNTRILESIPVVLPDRNRQDFIATILGTVDRAIRETEALIAKHQMIKAGLMHDLFTRGILPDGPLRPPPPKPPTSTSPHLLA